MKWSNISPSICIVHAKGGIVAYCSSTTGESNLCASCVPPTTSEDVEKLSGMKRRSVSSERRDEGRLRISFTEGGNSDEGGRRNEPSAARSAEEVQRHEYRSNSIPDSFALINCAFSKLGNQVYTGEKEARTILHSIPNGSPTGV
ncbi:hypothetical protein Trydic_g20969 [Trypoxylus dichotomus]